MSPYAAPEDAGLSASRLDRAYRFLDEAVQRGEIPGAAILVARHGIPMPPRGFGRQYLQADSPPIRPDTIFLVASVTKPVVVSAVMLLVERGRLMLDEPAATYVPEFGNQGKEAVTLRHLMTHTSGLPDMLPENEQLRRDHAPLSEFVAHICDLPLDFEPGTRIQYQSTGIAILGEIAARVTGVPLRDFLRRAIFDPLEMDDTALGAQGLPLERIAQVNVGPKLADADWNWNRTYWQNFGAPWGGMFTTVGDFFRFGQMMLNRGRFGAVQLFGPATVEAMVQDQTGPMPGLSVDRTFDNIWGLGWRLFPANRWRYFGNLVTPGTFGHGGATGTVVWMDPVREMVCALFTTEPSANSTGLLGRVSNLVAASAL